MKIMEVISNLGPGGGQRFVIDLSNSMVAKGEKVCILAFRTKTNNGCFYKDELSKNVSYIDYPGSIGFLSKIKQFFFVLKTLLREKPDVVHCHMLAMPFVILPSLLMKKTSFFYTVHNEAARDTNPGLGTFLRKFFLKKKISAITISSFCSKTFLDYYGYPSKMEIENGCRAISTSDNLLKVQNEINLLKTTKNTKVFVNVARVQPQKNHQLMIQAFEELISEGFDIALLIIGSYEGADDIMSRLRSMITSDRIHFLGTRHNIPDYLHCSDFFVLSSAWEGLPISILEAGLSGCYPISTPVGGVPDVITSDEWGVLSDDLSTSSFVRAIKKCLTNGVDRETVKRNYESRFLMNRCADEYIDCFRKSLKY